jgi:AcrR family transcriptional regulator
MREIASELGVSERSLTRWFKLPAVQQEQGRARAEAQAEHPLSIRATMEQQLLACRRDGSPDWTARAQAARILAELPADNAPAEPQLFSIRINADGSQEEVWGTPPPGFRSPAAFTMIVEDGAFPEGERDNNWA